MIPRLVCIQAIRGFQEEKKIPLSPSLTVIYGENGRGKTSLCEGWNWLFTGQMLVGLEPQSELGSAGKNIHVGELHRLMQLCDDNGNTIIARTDDQYQNPGNLPESTSPVLLQYRLNQVLYTSQGDRRRFFEEVMELDIEAAFAQKLRRACLSIDPFAHDAWSAWERAITSLEDQDFLPPNPTPSNADEQSENERALLQHVAEYLGTNPTLKGVEEVLEIGSEPEFQIEALTPPVSEAKQELIEEAVSAIDGLESEAVRALERAIWQEKGLELVQPPRCPFCNEETIQEGKIEEIGDGIRSVRKRHSSHLKAKSKVDLGITAVQPLVELDIETTRSCLDTLRELLPKLQIDELEQVVSCIEELDEALSALKDQHQQGKPVGTPDAFGFFAPTAMELTRTWLALSTYLDDVGAALKELRVRTRYMEAATSIIQYHRADLSEFYRQLDVRPTLDEIAEVGPRVIERIKNDRLRKLAEDIVDYYKILRPDDPTPLEDVQASGGVRGDIRIMARSASKVDHASALFSHSNSNALGMACHIARVLDAGFRTIVLDDPFQSLDDSNREHAVGDLVTSLLDDGLQVVVLTHERSTASKLLDIYADKGSLGTALRWDTDRGAIPEPMYASGDVQLSIVLDGLETDSLSEIIKVSNALRQLLEAFCADYLRAVGGDLPESHRRNLGSYIDCLEKLPSDVRPNQRTLSNLNDWNEKLSNEAHFHGLGIEGMNQLRAITREALTARKQEKQLRPPNMDHWKRVPDSEGIRRRARSILGI